MRRLLYNAVLAVIVLAYFLLGLPKSVSTISLNAILFLFILTVLCYCAACFVDLFAQYFGFRAAWLRFRWLLLALGITFAAAITRFFAPRVLFVQSIAASRIPEY